MVSVFTWRVGFISRGPVCVNAVTAHALRPCMRVPAVRIASLEPDFGGIPSALGCDHVPWA